jgi:hypothetical protein
MKTKEKLEGINLVTVWIARRIAPLKQRPTLMCHYISLKDDSHLTEVQWQDGGFESAVSKVTSLMLKHIKGTKKGYYSMKLPLTVSSATSPF